MIIGIDTSNYTTSVAVVSDEQQLLLDRRIILDVAQGERGLQQSAAVFQHLQNMPELLAQALDLYRPWLTGICFSATPRPREGSYMPVFKVGAGYARTLSAALGIPLLTSTHQEGHLAAGLWSSGFVPTGSFLTIHLSGGTTDLLLVKPLSRGFEIETLGSSSDIHAGQFVDRIGVALGLEFPAGMALERLVKEGNNSEGLVFPGSVDNYMMSFSGPCSAAKRALQSGEPPVRVAYGVFRCIANSLEKVLGKAMQDTGLKDILLVGGVAANSLIRERLVYRLEHRAVGGRLHFAEPTYCRDNAVGVALLGLNDYCE